MAKRKNIKELLDKDKDHNETIEYYPLEPKEEVDCKVCKNFDPKKQFCNTYDCYPIDNEIPPEEYCKEFMLDEAKEAKQGEASKRLWDYIVWEGKYEEKLNQWIEGVDLTISLHIKNEVWRRDQGSCVECGSSLNLEYVHIVPISKGGSNTTRNIQLICEKCNRKSWRSSIEKLKRMI